MEAIYYFVVPEYLEHFYRILTGVNYSKWLKDAVQLLHGGRR